MSIVSHYRTLLGLMAYITYTIVQRFVLETNQTWYIRLASDGENLRGHPREVKSHHSVPSRLQ